MGVCYRWRRKPCLGCFLRGCLRVIYRSTYVGISDRSHNSETSIFLMSTSETIETKITSVQYLIFHHEDTVNDPQTLVLLES